MGFFLCTERIVSLEVFCTGSSDISEECGEWALVDFDQQWIGHLLLNFLVLIFKLQKFPMQKYIQYTSIEIFSSYTFQSRHLHWETKPRVFNFQKNTYSSCFVLVQSRARTGMLKLEGLGRAGQRNSAADELGFERFCLLFHYPMLTPLPQKQGRQLHRTLHTGS